MNRISKIELFILIVTLICSLIFTSCDMNKAHPSNHETSITETEEFTNEETDCNHKYNRTETKPTCTDSGGVSCECVKCGHSYQEVVLEPINHSGVGTCTVCNREFSFILKAHFKNLNQELYNRDLDNTFLFHLEDSTLLIVLFPDNTISFRYEHNNSTLNVIWDSTASSTWIFSQKELSLSGDLNPKDFYISADSMEYIYFNGAPMLASSYSTLARTTYTLFLQTMNMSFYDYGIPLSAYNFGYINF